MCSIPKKVKELVLFCNYDVNIVGSYLMMMIYFDLGKDFIIEVNDTAPGLMYEHEEEDLGRIRDLVVQRLNEYYHPTH